MAEQPSHRDLNDTGTPRWLKVLGIVAVVAILLLVGSLFVGGGNHGPGRHTTPSSVAPSHPPMPGGQ